MTTDPIIEPRTLAVINSLRDKPEPVSADPADTTEALISNPIGKYSAMAAEKARTGQA